LQKAQTDFLSSGEIHINNLGLVVDVNICEEQNEDRLSIEITEPNKEITLLRREDARHAAVSKEVCETYKLKENLLLEKKLRTKISDLESEAHILKQENLKFSDNLAVKITELKEMDATHSAFKQQIRLMENENVENSETLKGSVREEESLNFEILNREEEKCKKIGRLTSENVKFKKEIGIINDKVVNLSKRLDVTAREVTELSENSKLKEEICSMRNDNLNLPDTLEGKILEIKQISSENPIKWDEVWPVRSNDVKTSQLHEHSAEKGKLMDEISSLECEVVSPSEECVDENVMKIIELSSENLLLKKEIYFHRGEITHLSACMKEKIIQVQELYSQNNKLKEEICFLKKNMLKISESREDITEIQKVVNENIILNDMGEEVSEEMVMKIEKLNFENSLLKENIGRLSCKLKEKAVELSELSSKLEEGKIEADNLKTKVSVLKKEILFLYHENINLSKMLNQKMQDARNMVPDIKSEVFLRQNSACMKGDANFSKIFGRKHEEMDRHKLEAMKLSPDEIKSAFQKTQLRDKPRSVHTNPVMKIVLQEEQRQNCLSKKVACQRRILNTIQKRELRMKTNMELCKELSLYFC
jgi:hypothetical protein